MFSYETIPGFFAQDDPLADPAVIDPVPARFGLLDASDARWRTFFDRLREMNASAASGVQYKFILFGRHGQGYHNVANSKYGNEAWDEHWSKLNGDGEIIWGPDPDLTPLGRSQALAAHAVWATERSLSPSESAIPLPGKQYCSPMKRALDTHLLTFGGIVGEGAEGAVVLENLREEYGIHTCDRRLPLSSIASSYPQFDFTLTVEEGGLTEADQLWTPSAREEPEHAQGRARNVLERMFERDEGVLFITVTAHSGIINAFLRVLGRGRYALRTGGVLPVVVKATRVGDKDNL